MASLSREFFEPVVNNPSVQHLWLNLSELQSLMNSLYKKETGELKGLYFKLGPVLESFFITYKGINDT